MTMALAPTASLETVTIVRPLKIEKTSFMNGHINSFRSEAVGTQPFLSYLASNGNRNQFLVKSRLPLYERASYNCHTLPASSYLSETAHKTGNKKKPEIRVVLNPQQPIFSSTQSSSFLSHTLLSQTPTSCSILCWSCCCCLAPFWFRTNCHIHLVIALICNLFVNLLMILCLLSTNWLTTTKYRQGLWQYCIDPDSPRPLPFGIESHDGCHWGRDAAYIKLAGFFAVACFFLSLIATVLTSFGLSSRDPNKKYTFYRFALYINLAALLSVIVALTLYPAFFYTELHHTNAVPANRPHWYFGWAYGVGWGSAIFLIGAVLLLVCDKETEEIYYKERTIVQTNGHHLSYQKQQQQQQHLLRNQMYAIPPQMMKT